MKKSIRTRQRILDTAIFLFKENGVQKTSIDEIVKLSGIAKGTFFYYYPKKDSIVFEIIDLEFKEYLSFPKEVAENTAINAVEKLQTVLLTLFNSFNKTSTLQQIFKLGLEAQFQNYINEVRLDKTIPIIKHIISQGTKDHIFRIEYISLSSEIITRGIISYVHSAYENLEQKDSLKEFMNGIEELLNNVLKSTINIKITP
jgi:AcrR family transcriptional regulator